MKQMIYSGPRGLELLMAHMRVAYAERKQGTGIGWHADYFRGWLHGLAIADAIAGDVSLSAHQFINERGFEQVQNANS